MLYQFITNANYDVQLRYVEFLISISPCGFFLVCSNPCFESEALWLHCFGSGVVKDTGLSSNKCYTVFIFKQWIYIKVMCCENYNAILLCIQKCLVNSVRKMGSKEDMKLRFTEWFCKYFIVICGKSVSLIHVFYVKR